MELLHTVHVPAGDGPFPTLLLLHGWGASAHDLIGLAPILHGGRALVLCPQGPVALEPGPGMIGYGWFPLSEGQPPDPTAVRMAQGLIEIFLDDACKKYPVDRTKLVLAGFSQGGFMAYQIALSDPARFAGLMALSAWLPDEVEKIAPQPAHAALPTLVIHGSKDPMVAIDRAYAARDALLRLGVPTVFREHEMAHEIRPEALRDMIGWLEQKVLAPISIA
ncbi:MAG: phospholipase [Deltaproteobacteria bacterium]|nr:MAG: phospholipase [Deltaproteobacteria bacterium]